MKCPGPADYSTCRLSAAHRLIFIAQQNELSLLPTGYRVLGDGAPTVLEGLQTRSQ